MAVFPQGHREAGDVGEDSGWNVGTAGDNSTCTAKTSGANCLVSCHKLGKCGPCNWSTCYDDVHFIQRLLTKLEEDLCLDSERFFAVGESNGAMLVHHLIQQLPGRFLAAVPVFGSPLLGYLVGAEYQLIAEQALARRTSILQLHDRSDTVIPWQGGESGDGWLYESRDRALGVWASLHACEKHPVLMDTIYSDGPANIKCFAYPGCRTGGRVTFCMYDGTHGVWPDQPRAVQLIWSFFQAAEGLATAGWVNAALHRHPLKPFQNDVATFIHHPGHM